MNLEITKSTFGAAKSSSGILATILSTAARPTIVRFALFDEQRARGRPSSTEFSGKGSGIPHGDRCRDDTKSLLPDGVSSTHSKIACLCGDETPA